MARVQASSTARGYGYPHQKLQAALLANWRPGDPCARCGGPMWHRWTVSRTGKRISAIHLDHDDRDRTRYRGLSHMKCNVGAANRRRAGVQANRRPPSRW